MLNRIQNVIQIDDIYFNDPAWMSSKRVTAQAIRLKL
ncbi:hypothetical protein O77CONTIG1_04008 [Leptolyngbya sp. O-77]|nr:hypothetical protein O77CONTIG1_04008 [Leptolyngbya sp. O-77]